MRRLPPLNALRSFEAAARLGSFNQAADELFVTPSAVSHQVKALEAFLGMSLFRREKRKVFLTTAGEKYLVAIQLALDEIDSATRRLMASPNAGAVNIAVAPAFLTRWLVPRLADFQKQYPDVELRLSTLSGLIDFEHSDTDMAIYFGDGRWKGVEAHFMRNSAIKPVCSPLLLEEGKLTKPEDLKNHTLIHVSSRSQEWHQLLHQEGISWSRDQKSLTFSNTSLALNAAMEGLGVALSDSQLIEREVQYGQLVQPFDMVLQSARNFYLVYSNKRQPTFGMESFRDWLMVKMEEYRETDTGNQE
ncbi:transcriptional regulator GcvA [Pontibacterium granulatum]|uniref:transcriptional regulator GcvA n=1 Tax=Pontibacterium granulatum TaxID=2036029 RepID=UPI00249B5FF7|nr:transcriptional regulator GcvA [Pontibacterium granulatum]MDI3326796.1 transcriptional regulator GcvA [Pontibacterium granulatum]